MGCCSRRRRRECGLMMGKWVKRSRLLYDGKRGRYSVHTFTKGGYFMLVRLVRGYASGLVLVLFISTPGCSGLKAGTNGTLPSSAYFAVETKDLNALHSLARKQEAALKGCIKVSCEDARYTLGLVALFENRADALNIFQQLHTTTPDGLFAASSARWIQLLQDSAPAGMRSSALFAQFRQEILHGLVDRDELTVSRRTTVQERRIAELGR